MESATSLGTTLRRAFTVGAAPLIVASAEMRARSIGIPLIGKLSTARCVWACHLACDGTRTSPMESCSMRKSLMRVTLRRFVSSFTGVKEFSYQELLPVGHHDDTPYRLLT